MSRALVVIDAEGVLAVFGPYPGDVIDPVSFMRLDSWALDCGDPHVEVLDVEIHDPSTAAMWVTDPEQFYGLSRDGGVV